MNDSFKLFTLKLAITKWKIFETSIRLEEFSLSTRLNILDSRSELSKWFNEGTGKLFIDLTITLDFLSLDKKMRVTFREAWLILHEGSKNNPEKLSWATERCYLQGIDGA